MRAESPSFVNNQKNVKDFRNWPEHRAQAAIFDLRVSPTEIQSKTKEKRNIVMYEPDFDSEKYQALQILQETNPDEYRVQKEALDRYTACNIKTALGERCNAALSKKTDFIRDGKIYGSDSNEPLLDIFIRGQQYRKEHGSIASDQLRETAEVETFKKIQAVLTDKKTPLGTTMFFVSPPGRGNTVYTHNFYDVFTLQEQNGDRVISYTRFSSGLSSQEALEKLRIIDPSYGIGEKVDDVYFLKNPLTLDPTLYNNPNADDIHEFLHKDHVSTTLAEYEAIIQNCTPFIGAYIEYLSQNPYDIFGRNLRYNALLNKADQIASHLKKNQDGTYSTHGIDFTKSLVYQIDMLGREEVREAFGACGFSGGFATSESSAFSVFDFGTAGKDTYGERSFSCPACNSVNVRPENELLTHCQHCGVDVRC